MLGKILVCITPQSNSTRLIDKAADLAAAKSGELHILHIEKGNNLFFTAETPVLLQQLFVYGAERGGVVHGLCGDDIASTIKRFVRENEITCAVFGEPPATAVAAPSIIQRFRDELPMVETVVVPREG